MASSIPGGTCSEHLGQNTLVMITWLAMIQELYSRLEDIGYLRKIDQPGT